MKQFYANYPVTCNWDCHKQRGSLGGVDRGMPKGTNILACHEGIVSFIANNGTGGHTATILHPDGTKTQYMHLSQFIGAAGRRVTEGELIGKSGGVKGEAGSGSSTGPHLHAHSKDVAGNRVPAFYESAKPIGPTERQVRPEGPELLRRLDPNRSRPDIDPDLAPGQTGSFKGWIHGEHVVTAYADTDVWLEGISGNWFWSGGTTEPGATHDLADRNPPPPVAVGERVIGPKDANVRAASNTSAAIVGSYPAGSKQVFKYWQKGQLVEQNGISTDIWYATEDEKYFVWAGGCTSIDKTGLTELVGDTPPPVVDPDNPAGLPEYPPVWDRAVKGLKAPLGYKDGAPVSRMTKGDPPVATDGVIRYLGLHHTGTVEDCLNYFSTANERGSCPSYYVRTDGETFELIRPAGKPASAGPEWNYRSIQVEMLNVTGDPTWGINEIQRTRAAELAVRMQEATLFEDGLWDGVPIAFEISAETILGHSQMTGGTLCPGPDMHVGDIVDEALRIWETKHPSEPEPGPVDPEIKEQLDRIEVEQKAQRKILEDLSTHLGKPVE